VRVGAGERGGDGEQRRRVERARPAQQARPLGHRGDRAGARLPVGDRGEHDDRQRAADAERDAQHQAELDVAHRDAHRGERRQRPRQDVRREAHAEQDAVQAPGEGQRQDPPPGLRHLAAQLRRDAHAGRVEHRRGDGDRDRDAEGQRRGRAAGERAERGQAAERDRPAERRPGRERGACRHRPPPPARMAVGPERVDHREAARRPRAGQPGDEPGERQRDGGELHQHGTFVWKYMTQNTLRPR